MSTGMGGYGAVFLGAELAQYSVWLLIPALSMGVVLRLATVVIEAQHGIGGVFHWCHGYFDPCLRCVIGRQREIDGQRLGGVARWNKVAPA